MTTKRLIVTLGRPSKNLPEAEGRLFRELFEAALNDYGLQKTSLSLTGHSMQWLRSKLRDDRSLSHEDAQELARILLSSRLGKHSEGKNECRLRATFHGVLFSVPPHEIAAIIPPGEIARLAGHLAKVIANDERRAGRRISEATEKRYVLAIRKTLRRKKLETMAESLSRKFFVDAKNNQFTISGKDASDSILVLIERTFRGLPSKPVSKRAKA
jgi:hypothetical protein